jgi:O-antigen ligase
LVLLWLVGHVVTTIRRFRAIAVLLSVMAVPIAASAIGEYAASDHGSGEMFRISGYDSTLAGNPNDLAMLLSQILPFTIAIVLTARRRIVKLAFLLVAGALIAAIICSLSRAGFVMLAVMGMLYLTSFVKERRRGWLLGLVVAAVLGITFAPDTYLSRVETITSVESDVTGSAQERWADMQAALSFIVRNPIFGAGFGSTMIALNLERGDMWKEVHNIYLVYAVDLGLLGFALFVLLMLRTLRTARSLRQRCAGVSGREALYRFAEATEKSLIAFALGAFFTPSAYLAYFYYFGGLALALPRIAAAELDPPGRPG